MSRAIRVLLPVLVLAAAGWATHITLANRPEPQRRPPRVAMPQVEVLTLEREDYPVWLHSRGTVRPRTESTLIPEVSGRIVEMSPKLRAGEFFEAGDLLLRIDARDYEAEMIVARATLAQARSTLAEEQARADQARRDWQRLGEKGTPDDLVLRKPQLAGARAAVSSAAARLDRARLDLERTVIRAPYAGRVLTQEVDVGQYVSPGTTLARVYAVDHAEVRLPLSNRQLAFVDVPETYRGDAPVEQPAGPALELSARVGAATHTWQGQVVRAEGAIDTETRQLFVVGQVVDPYGKGPPGRPPLKVGQFVEARIRGNTLEQVFVVPRSALQAGSRVHVLDAENRVRARQVEVLHGDDRRAAIATGLESGDRLVVTPLGAGMEGVQVTPLERGAAPVGGPAAERGAASEEPGAARQPSAGTRRQGRGGSAS